MRERCMENGASQGEEAVLADSGLVGEVPAGGWAGEKSNFSSNRLVKHHGFSAIYQDPSFYMAAHGAGQHNLLQVPSLSH